MSNIEDIKKMAQKIANDQPKNNAKLTSSPKTNSSDDVDDIVPSKISSSQKELYEPKKQSNSEQSCETSECKLSSSTMNLFGLVLPKQTFYLFLILIVIGIIIWYLSKPKKSKKHDDE